jgi:chorismate mutase
LNDNNGPSEDEKANKLIEYRNSIDNIDAAVINMLAERFKITQKVGVYKAKYGLPASDKDREANQIERLRKLAEDAQLDPNFSVKFLDFIIEGIRKAFHLIFTLDSEIFSIYTHISIKYIELETCKLLCRTKLLV